MRGIFYRHNRTLVFVPTDDAMCIEVRASGEVAVQPGRTVRGMEGLCVLATGLSADHAEAVAKDLASWLCNGVEYLSAENGGIVPVPKGPRIYDAEDAVERLRPVQPGERIDEEVALSAPQRASSRGEAFMARMLDEWTGPRTARPTSG